MNVNVYMCKPFMHIRFSQCFAADEAFTSLGTEYYFAFPKNLESLPSIAFAPPNLRFKVLTDENTSTDIEVFTSLSEETLHFTAPTEIEVDIGNELTSIAERNKGLKIISGGNGVSVVALSEEYTSADTFLLLPPVYIPGINYEYYAVSVERAENETVHKSAVLIVATEDDTYITLIPTADVNIASAPNISGSGDIGEPIYVTLKQMDTLYVTSLENLSGTRAVANKPITFISGHECGTLPTGESFCDQMFEQISPTTTWGKEFYTVPLGARQSFDIFMFVASANDTVITRVCNLNRITYNIPKAGDVISLNVTSQEFCSFTSNNPVLLVQFAVATTIDNVTADPFMMVVPPFEQYRKDYLIPTFESRYGDLTSFVNIVIKAVFDRTALRFNGSPIEDEWTNISCDGDVMVPCAYGIQLNIGATGESQNTLSTEQPDATFGVTVYSFGTRVGQGHVGGLNQLPVTCKLLPYNIYLHNISTPCVINQWS